MPSHTKQLLNGFAPIIHGRPSLLCNQILTSIIFLLGQVSLSFSIFLRRCVCVHGEERCREHTHLSVLKYIFYRSDDSDRLHTADRPEEGSKRGGKTHEPFYTKFMSSTQYLSHKRRYHVAKSSKNEREKRIS
jgi:hypothetical protein